MNAHAHPRPADAGLIAPDAIALRDWFAGHVVAAMLVAPKQPGVPRNEMEGMAKAAYEYADAMIKARGA